MILPIACSALQSALPFHVGAAAAAEVQLSPEAAAQLLGDWQAARAAAMGPAHEVLTPQGLGLNTMGPAHEVLPPQGLGPNTMPRIRV